MGTPESFCGGGLLSDEGKASFQKGGSEFKLGGSEKFFPAEFFFSTPSFSEKSWVAVGMCAGRLEISGQDG